MLRLREIQTTDASYTFVEQLWLATFPDNERRATEAQRYNTDHNPVFHCMLAEEENEPVGFFTYWDFGQYCYGEHFATQASIRNQGYGSRIICALYDHIQRPLVLEVEMPNSDISMRRIHFYQRHGLQLWEGYDYIQPPYSADSAELPMLLMASRELNPQQDFNHVVQTIHHEVYGYGKP